MIEMSQSPSVTMIGTLTQSRDVSIGGAGFEKQNHHWYSSVIFGFAWLVLHTDTGSRRSIQIPAADPAPP